jgi:hypothetical protein
MISGIALLRGFTKPSPGLIKVIRDAYASQHVHRTKLVLSPSITLVSGLMVPNHGLDAIVLPVEARVIPPIIHIPKLT